MTIRIRRKRQYFAIFRRVRLVVDGIQVAKLRPGQSIDLEGTGAPQAIRAHLDWTPSNEVSVVDPGDSEHITVEVCSPALFRAMWYSLTRSKEALVLTVKQ